jgi:hypothetical protein
MAIIERIDGIRLTLGGEPHSGWLPLGAAAPRPTPMHEIELDLTIESENGGGFLLIFESRDGSIRGDTWHESLADARDEARRSFGIALEAWRPIDRQ